MNTRLKLIGLISISVMLLASCGDEQGSSSQDVGSQKSTLKTANPPVTGGIDKTNPDWREELDQPAQFPFEPGKTYYWDLVTNKGDMSFKLYHQSAPMHVSSTIYLTEIGFYDDLIFHRIIPGFMAQGGDPTGTGRGGPGYQYEGEFDGSTSHSKPGMLSMANAGSGTDGSQFFVTFVPTEFLDGKHTIFGELNSGEETLKMLEQAVSRSGATSEIVKIEKATIRVE